MHARNVIAFFVWAWPSGFCDWSCFPWWTTSWRGTVGLNQVGVPQGRLFPSGLCFSAISRVVWAWPDPLPTGLNGDGKNVQTLWWAELDRLHSMTRAHPPLLPLYARKGVSIYGFYGHLMTSRNIEIVSNPLASQFRYLGYGTTPSGLKAAGK